MNKTLEQTNILALTCRGAEKIAIIALVVSALAGCEAAKRSSLQDSAAPLPPMVRPGNTWREPTRLELHMRESRSSDDWTFDFSTAGIVHVTAGGDAKAVNGEMLFIDGQLLLTRQLTLPAGAELDYFDDLILKQQLVVALLDEAFPQGPQAVVGSLLVALDDRGLPVHTETTNTSRVYYPPWSLRAQARREDAETLAVNLTFDTQSRGAGSQRMRMDIEARWSKAVMPLALGDEMPLEQWRAYRLRLGTKSSGGLTVAAWVAVSEARRYRTLGDARRSVTPRR